MDTDGGANTLEQKDAEKLARLFSVAFNSAALYGGSHPTTRKSSIPLADSLAQTLQRIDLVSFIVDRESLFVEAWCVDKVVNPRRIIVQFAKEAIQSVSFERGVTTEAVVEFVKIAGDMKKVLPADRIETLLREAGHAGVRLNYVRYGRITTDQKVIGADAVVAGAGDDVIGPHGGSVSASPSAPIAATALRELNRILSLKALLEHPEEVSSGLSRSIGDPEGATHAADSLAQLRTEVERLPDSSANLPTIEALLHAVYELKMDLQEALQVQKETGKIIAAAAPVHQELDRLTCDVIVKLVREEYRGGGVSIGRLAHVIRRMLPDMSELKRLLPLLKEGLLADGMTLQEYLKFVKEIRVELESEQLADVLRDAAEHVGASVDEVVEAIKAEPADTARLLMLASEIRNGAAQNENQLSDFLTDYIEKASKSLALSSREISGPGGGKLLRKIVARVESELVERLRVQGVNDSVVDAVRQKLAGRIGTACTSAATQWMVNVVSTERETPLSQVLPLLEGLIEHDGQLQGIRDPLTAALKAKGYEAAEIEAFFKEAARHVDEGRPLFELPSGILSTNNILFFLNREIKQHLRYKSPFSALMITIDKVRSDGTCRPPSKDELAHIMPGVYSLTRGMLRDLDLIGSPGKLESNNVFVILTMTPEQGADVVRRRLYQKIGELKVTSADGAGLQVEAAISVTVPTPETVDIRTFMDLVKRRHREEMASRKISGN